MKGNRISIAIVCIAVTGMMYGCVKKDKKKNKSPVVVIPLDPTAGFSAVISLVLGECHLV